ncbi:MAG TPA: membrane protein insertase YidC [Balneolaceae bacterium]|nr:membrane protein insertase YidC [Balneolaceae bacterium]
MDRNTVIGLLLIFALTIGWAFYTMPSQEEIDQRRAEQAMQDSLAATQAQQQAEFEGQQDSLQSGSDTEMEIGGDSMTDRGAQSTAEITESARNLGVFSANSAEDTVKTVIQTPLYEIELSNLGGGPVKYTLADYNTWDQEQVQMIRDTTRSAYSLGFLSSQNYNIETNNLLFDPLQDTDVISLDGSDSTQVSYAYRVDDTSEIIFTYTFHADHYSYTMNVEFVNMDQYISGAIVDLGWMSGLRLTERDRTLDVASTAAYVFAGGELEKLQLEEEGEAEQQINGTIGWVSTRTKFFGQYIMPLTNSTGALLMGEVEGVLGEAGTEHTYRSVVQSNIAESSELSYEMFLGPLEYYKLRDYDEHAYDVVEIGYALIRWFADPLVRYLVIPFFTFGSMFISNYGVLIILFGVIVKLVLFPLTQKSFKSMAAMKDLQPQMKEIQEKYKDDPQKQQKETIALYKRAKVNPLGGCLPMFLQFPILITLFFFFQNAMVIRQKSFLWANDLSAPDYILDLPFTIPLLGDQLAGFVLFMSAAMFLQTKVSGGMSGGGAPSGGPNMKAFQYVIPFVLLFVFNNFAAGLSLYYLVYNVLSVAQQWIINKQSAAKNTEAVAVETSNNRKGRKKKK